MIFVVDIMSALGDMIVCGGYHECIGRRGGGCLVHWQNILNAVWTSLLLWNTPTALRIFPNAHMISPNALMISPKCTEQPLIH